MNIAIVTDQGRITHLSQGGHILLASENCGMYECRIIDTGNWDQLSWGRKLMYHNVDVLICTGIEQFQYGMIKGFGISIVPNAFGPVLEVIQCWRSGNLDIPKLWPLL